MSNRIAERLDSEITLHEIPQLFSKDKQSSVRFVSMFA